MRGIRVKVRLISDTPMSQTRYHNTAKLDRESHEDYEDRTWREKMHADEKGGVIVTEFALKNMLVEAAVYSPIKLKGNSTFTKVFKSAVRAEKSMALTVPGSKLKNIILKDEVQPMSLFVPAIPSKREGSPRVLKHFPVIPAWEGVASFLITDVTLPESVFIQVLENGGRYIGLGSLRVKNGGVFGQFSIGKHSWEVVGE